MNVVDSSGWLEYFADNPGAEFFAPAIEDMESLVVPVITIYEVYKRLHMQRGREVAMSAIAYMSNGKVVDLGTGTAIEAAEFSAKEKVPMAGSVIYTLARQHNAILWTQDVDLDGYEGVAYQAKTA